jgi:hypothetical protein
MTLDEKYKVEDVVLLNGTASRFARLLRRDIGKWKTDVIIRIFRYPKDVDSQSYVKQVHYSRIVRKVEAAEYLKLKKDGYII